MDRSTTDIILIITAIGAALGSLITAILGALAAFYAARAKQAAEESRNSSKENAKALEAVDKSVGTIKEHTNSITEKLMAETRSSALQEGHTQGVKDQKEETKSDGFGPAAPPAIKVEVMNEPLQVTQKPKP